jgi:hypothetical protein
MSVENKIEQYLKDIIELENVFREAQGKEILPLSFFNVSFDILNRLKIGVFEIEAEQLQMMQEHLKKSETEWNEANEIKQFPAAEETVETGEIAEPPVELKLSEEKATPAANVLADTISRKINLDFGKSLSLNDRFMFQRDLFQGNTNEMNQAFAQIGAFHSLHEVMEFLNEKYNIPWKSESGIVFKELLDKRFT